VFAAATVLALAFAGCDILAKLGFGEDEADGGSGPNITTAIFTGIEPVADNATTTTLLLVFDRDIPGLKKEHVTIRSVSSESSENSDGAESPDGFDSPVSSNSPDISEISESPESSETDALQAVAVESIGKTDDRPGVYTLALSNIDMLEESLWPVDSFSGTLDITVAADTIPGYHVADPSHQTPVYVVPPRRAVQFSSAAAAGSAVKTKTTAALVLQMSDVDGLELEQGDVVLSPSGTANTKIATGVPEKTGGAWKIPVTGIDTGGTVTVTLTRNGYVFKPSPSIDVQVCYAEQVTLVTADADGSEVLARRTTKLTLAFDKPVDNLKVNNITIAANGTGAAVGSFGGSGKSYTLTLASNSVTKSGMIDVTVTKDGYDISNGSVQVAVYDNQYSYLATGGSSVSIIQVGDVYYELHKFTSTETGQSLVVKSGAPALTARVLVVAGGGGAAGTSFPSSGAGAGGMVENDAYPLSVGTYSVTVGAGGTGGAQDKDGTDGSASSFGEGIIAYGGGASKSRPNGNQQEGKAGGSSSGGKSSPNVKAGTGGNSFGNKGGTTTNDNSNYAGGGGGAGGAGKSGDAGADGGPADRYAGPGRSNNITGGNVTYAAGGPTTAPRSVSNANYAGVSGAVNTGNGGGGAWNNKGGNGGSGIVIVRFPVY
jgi:hypothetical protein